MSAVASKLTPLRQANRALAVIALAWTLAISGSLAWNLNRHSKTTAAELHLQVKAIHAINMEYRNWIIHTGGVYVPSTEKTLPSLWLDHVPERDVTTPSGKNLTLLNSSYAMRLVQELMERSDSNVHMHIASLQPINPTNKADSWEREALLSFTHGATEHASLEVMPDGKTYFRYMRPMVTDASCLKCHARYGDKLGDIRGGVSVSLPVDQVLAAAGRERLALIGGHGLIWMLGLLGLYIASRQQRNSVLEIMKSEEQVTLLTNAIAHAIFGVDMKGRCTFANQACAKILGYARPELLIGKDMHALIHHTRQDGTPCPAESCSLIQALGKGEASTQEGETFWRQDGTSFLAAYWSYPVILEGEMQGAVITFQDVTESLRVKSELKHSQTLLHSIVENIPAMIFVKRAEDLRFELLNLAGERLLGTPRQELLGKNDYDLFPPEQADAFTHKDREVLASRQPVEVPEESLTVADGTQHWLHTFKTGLYDEQNRPTHLLGISLDITDSKRAEDKLREQQKILEQTLEGTIHTVSMAVELRDPYTAGHQRRVARLACAIAEKMGLDPELIHGIRLGAMIHDIGKIGIPAEILSKPSRLTSVEMQIVRQHPSMGYDILKNVNFPWPVAEIAYQHHERMDGSGYPNGLRGEEIQLEARIVAVADVVESMVSHRPYRPAQDWQTAKDEVAAHRGTHFDPAVVDACLAVLEAGFEFE